jgi:hypothetical protein
MTSDEVLAVCCAGRRAITRMRTAMNADGQEVNILTSRDPVIERAHLSHAPSGLVPLC